MMNNSFDWKFNICATVHGKCFDHDKRQISGRNLPLRKRDRDGAISADFPTLKLVLITFLTKSIAVVQ